jgi:hypothetical protein
MCFHLSDTPNSEEPAMTKKTVIEIATHYPRKLSRREALALGALATTTLGMQGGLIRLAGAQTAATFDFYIGPNGSDSNPGTASQPWALTALNTKRATYAGKAVGLLDGTYDMVAIMGQPTSTFDSGSLAIAGGNASSPTVIQAVSPLKAVIDWNRAAVTNSSIGASFQPAGDYVTIDGLHLTNNNYRAICNYAGGGNHFTVRNCLFTKQSYTAGPTGANSCMIYTQGHNDILISNCRFEGGGSPVDGNRHAVIQTYLPSRRVTIEYCSFIAETGTGNCIHFKQGNNYSPVVRYCYFNRAASTNGTSSDVINLDGSLDDASDHAVFHHNIMIPGSTRPIFTLSHLVGIFDFYNNTLVGPWSMGGNIVHMESGPPTQVNFYNNILYRRSGGAGTYGDMMVNSIGSIGTMDNNYYPASSLKLGVGYNAGGLATSYGSLASWRTASGKDANSAAGDNPLIMASGTDADYYRLQSGSPCKSLGAGGTEIGAWGGASRVGSSFGGGLVLPAPVAPSLTTIT